MGLGSQLGRALVPLVVRWPTSASWRGGGLDRREMRTTPCFRSRLGLGWRVSDLRSLPPHPGCGHPPRCPRWCLPQPRSRRPLPHPVGPHSTSGTRQNSIGATIRLHRLPRVAEGCKTGLDKPICLLAVAHRGYVLRPEWCQQWCQKHHRVVVTRSALRSLRAALLSPSKPGVDVFFSSSPLTLL